jgi:hypothetical protein
MRPVLLCLSAVLLSAGLLVRPAAAAKYAGKVKDGAKMFSRAAVRLADKKLRKMADTYGLDVVIETIPTLTEEERQQLGSWRFWPMKRRVVAELARQRAEKADLDGVYVAIWAAPKLKEVVVTLYPEARDDVLGGGGRAELRRTFVRDLAEQPDHALAVGVDDLDKLLQRRFSAGSTTPLTGLQALAGVGGCLGLWVFLLALRARLRRSEEPADPVERSPALLAALFGMPAGYWTYDRLFRAGGPVPSLVGTPLPLLAPAEAPAREPAEGQEADAGHDQAAFD